MNSVSGYWVVVALFYRTVRIPLEEGDKWVEVIGTYVIPEFGSIVIIILISKDHTYVEENFVQVEYEEIAVSSDYRTIRIPLEEGDKWVEVIGTYVIPEFGSIVIIILVVSVSSAIIISKSRFSVSYN